MKTDIIRLDETIANFQKHNSKRFDKLESDIGNLFSITKTLKDDSTKMLELMKDWNHTSKRSSTKVSLEKTTRNSKSSSNGKKN